MQEKYSISCEMTGQPSSDPAEDEDKATDHKGKTKGRWTNNNAWVWLNSVCGLPVRVHNRR
jgi:hypothetical protein